MIKVHLNTIFRKGHRVFLHFRNRKGGKYRGAFLLAENDDLASKTRTRTWSKTEKKRLTGIRQF